jgi:epoxyqueuosine reductase
MVIAKLINENLTQEIKEMALQNGFNAVGITNPSRLEDLPYGWVGDITELRRPEAVLPQVKSVIILGLHTWDRAFFLQIDSPKWKGYRFHYEEEIEGYYISYAISKNKAWPIVTLLRQKGYKATITTAIPMKTAAVKAGLGCQGKCTLLVNPETGPRLGLMGILTSAELENSEPYTADLCYECDLCIKACPTNALTPYKIEINRCLAYASENPGLTSIPSDVRDIEEKVIVRPTSNSYVECSICMHACPIGK